MSKSLLHKLTNSFAVSSLLVTNCYSSASTQCSSSSCPRRPRSHPLGRRRKAYRRPSDPRCNATKLTLFIPGGGVPRWKLNPWGGWKCKKIKELWGARSLLYRSRFLQPKIRSKAFAKICTMHSVVQVSNLIFLSISCRKSLFFSRCC